MKEKIQGAMAALDAECKAQGLPKNEEEIMEALVNLRAFEVFVGASQVLGPDRAIASAMTLGFSLGQSVARAESLEKAMGL